MSAIIINGSATLLTCPSSHKSLQWYAYLGSASYYYYFFSLDDSTVASSVEEDGTAFSQFWNVWLPFCGVMLRTRLFFTTKRMRNGGNKKYSYMKLSLLLYSYPTQYLNKQLADIYFSDLNPCCHVLWHPKQNREICH